MTEPLPYALAAEPRAKSSTVGFLLGLLGLGLILVGGCFLIGVLIMNLDSPSAGYSYYWTAARVLFVGVLYACAAACFAGGAVVLKRGVQRLMAA